MSFAYVGAQNASIIALLEPIGAVVFAAIILSRQITLVTLMGGGLILLWCADGHWGWGDGGLGMSELKAAGTRTQRPSSLTCEHAAIRLNQGNAAPSQAFERIRQSI